MADYTPNGSTIIPGIDLDATGRKVQALQLDGTYKWVNNANSPTPVEDLIWSDAGINIRTLNGALNVINMGAVGNGIADDTAVFQAAATSGGLVIVPGGKQYRITSTITIGKGTMFVGWGAAAGAVTAVQSGLTTATLIHDFSGDFFRIVGVSGDSQQGIGSGLKNLVLLQNNGNGSGVSGKAIVVVGTSDSFAPSWAAIEDVHMEKVSGKNDWTWGVEFDGSALTNGLRDSHVYGGRISCGPNSVGAINVIKGANIRLAHVYCNLSSGTSDHGQVQVTGSGGNPSGGTRIVGVSALKLNIDFAANTYVTGGDYNDVTTTANSAGSILQLNFCTNVPSLAGTVYAFKGYVNASGRFVNIETGTGASLYAESWTAPTGQLFGSLVGAITGAVVAPTYGASVAISNTTGNVFKITATNGTAFTLENPANRVGSIGQVITLQIRNASGGALGVATFSGDYKLGAAWVQPANGFSRSITFYSDGTNWIEIGRTAADVAN